jgi:hypothetical protein
VRFETARSHGEEYLIAICVGKRTLIVGFHLGERITLAFKNICDGYSFERDTLTILENKNTLLKHSISSVWQFAEKVTLVKYAVQRKKELFTLHEKLVPYAFLEALLTGDQIDCYLGGSVKENADKISGFFENFIGILPPPTFRKNDEIGLLYHIKGAQYRVEYFTFEIENRKIYNIKKAD